MEVVHRDVSPPNIVISFAGAVRVIDFGVAQVLGCAAYDGHGATKGKLSYMSPEQAKGEPVDRRADVFALGTILWEALTGQPLFARAEPADTMRALLFDPIPPPSQRRPVPPELEAIVMRALERDPAARFETAREIQVALVGYLNKVGAPAGAELAEFMSREASAKSSAGPLGPQQKSRAPTARMARRSRLPRPGGRITRAAVVTLSLLLLLILMVAPRSAGRQPSSSTSTLDLPEVVAPSAEADSPPSPESPAKLRGASSSTSRQRARMARARPSTQSSPVTRPHRERYTR
jgi:serine/threonine protein kinase